MIYYLATFAAVAAPYWNRLKDVFSERDRLAFVRTTGADVAIPFNAACAACSVCGTSRAADYSSKLADALT